MSHVIVEHRGTDRCATPLGRYDDVRALTELLAAPLSPEDQVVQSMPDVSPTKWHRGHTTWFFETFILETRLPGYVPFDRSFPYIFNSYYESLGDRHPRSQRGLISRPGTEVVTAYRRHVDQAMARLLDVRSAFDAPSAGPSSSPDHARPGDTDLDLSALLELGLNHEQQHQELIVMDIKHVLWSNPALPVYTPAVARSGNSASAPGPQPGWIEHPGGMVEIGHGGGGFAFDNEQPRHERYLAPFAICDRPVTCGDWLEFMDDGGYSRPELWLSDGWATIQEHRWSSPLYWCNTAPSGTPDWRIFTLGGLRDIDPDEPVCHVSYFEADAFAHWATARLPTEVEWESVAGEPPPGSGLLDRGVLHPRPVRAGDPRFFGDVWEWTQSAYSAYPGFKVAPGAVGEYNGKFMVNQYVLRGGSCATPPGHVRATYRNFFPAGARWPFTGLRLARDLDTVVRPDPSGMSRSAPEGSPDRGPR